ncbi:pirin family protein [Burkholderia cepacia]|uniref:Pirin family protein n=1 Tax=Burkholderia cepacia TaxID=292 RepID=A0A2S8ILL7_BURCE|nr:MULTISPECIES: pirin family protein [Burkholderia cepacia complex]KFL52199.1 quercetin 2,3-dioxygenase [Burkholderia pyrrocinia]PQP15674.1 pirin family protein [Burkholderia cepacia]TDA42702.1 pirin family protein [Burkholderia pyrrocinia]UOB60378.1 pirin family protein [Burkholderia pyrrocinia]HDR9508801.1 pirin family protein [Burkholderia cepacia]
MIEIRAANQRGRAEHGWLSSRHTFSFANYYDPKQVGFSDLLVINDDRVAPGRGFGTHPHRDMEILSYVLDGALEHKDSMGTGSVIVPGDVQLMSAGTGVRHSEFNHSPDTGVHFLQIWVGPAEKGAEPRYQQTNVAADDKRGKLTLVVSPNGDAGSLKIRQDTRIYAGLFDGDERATLELAPDRFAYVHVARGSVTVNGVTLGEGDGARIRGEQALTLADGNDAEVLVFDLRPVEVTAEWA